MYVQNNLRKTINLKNNLLSDVTFALSIAANIDVKFFNLSSLKHIFADSEVMRIPGFGKPLFMFD